MLLADLTIPSLPPISLGQLQVLAATAASALGVGFTIARSPLLIAKVTLVRQRDEARNELAEARAHAEALATSAEALATSAEALLSIGNEVRDLKRQVGELRKLQVISSRYIADLIAHIRRRGTAATMPAIPPELSDEVLAELRAHPDADEPESILVVSATAAVGATGAGA